MMPFALAVATLLLSAELSAFEPQAPYHEPNAVLLNISEADLNRIVRDVFREHVGSKLEGASSDPSRGVRDLRYAASFSDPIVDFDDDGGVRIDLSLLEADLRIGRFEHKFRRKTASCDGAGVHVNPDRPVELAVRMNFEVEDHDLQIVPSSVTVDDPKGFRLVKPTKCRNTWLPKWVIWQIGKGQLRRKIKGLDDWLLAQAREGAAELSAETGVLLSRWSIDARGDSNSEAALHLYPQEIDTSHGSLLVGFAGSTTALKTTDRGMPDWVAAESDRSYVGLSESFLNSVALAAVGRLRTEPREASGGLAQLFGSAAGRSLIPGLRGVESPEKLRLGWAFHRAPEIEFEALESEPPTGASDAVANRALIRVRLSGAQLTIWDSDELLGTLEIESAKLAVAPYRNLLGGISFDLIENDWKFSSEGIDFDEETLAAVFQELFFGEIFETRYQPLAQDAFDLGETKFQPRYFSIVGGYLLIGLSGL